jgi:hypothetical protein
MINEEDLFSYLSSLKGPQPATLFPLSNPQPPMEIPTPNSLVPNSFSSSPIDLALFLPPLHNPLTPPDAPPGPLSLS